MRTEAEREYQNEYHRQQYIDARKKRDGIAARIEAIGQREDQRKAANVVFFEAPNSPVYNSHKRIRVAKVG